MERKQGGQYIAQMAELRKMSRPENTQLLTRQESSDVIFDGEYLD